MKRYVRFFLLAGCIAGTSHPAAGTQEVTLSVRPSVAVEHGTAMLLVLVERNELNRVLQWEMDGPNYYRSSTRQLDGAASPRTWTFTVRDLPEGEYGIRATVRRSNDSQVYALGQIRVVPASR
jgi:hypothetical protein